MVRHPIRGSRKMEEKEKRRKGGRNVKRRRRGIFYLTRGEGLHS